MRNRKGTIVGLTCRVGRAVTGHIDMIRDLLDGNVFCPAPLSLLPCSQLHCMILLPTG